MLDLTEQLQAGGLAQQPEEATEFIEELGTGQGLGLWLGPAHGRAYVDTRIMHEVRKTWT
jgi:hypothetical protein